MVSDSNIDDEYRLFCLNVGHLFTAFARLENTLTGSLKLHLSFNFAKPGDTRSMKLASAIYGSMRFKASRDTIKRILVVEGAAKETTALLENVFAQIGHIESFRDKIAHQTVTPAHSGMGGFWQVTDMLNTRDLVKTQAWVFDTDALAHASRDLLLATDIIGGRNVNVPLFGDLPDLAPPAWQYKPSMLKLVPRSKLRTPPPQ